MGKSEIGLASGEDFPLNQSIEWENGMKITMETGSVPHSPKNTKKEGKSDMLSFIRFHGKWLIMIDI